MRILLVTPAPPRSRKGNRITALRWKRMLQQLGHTVELRESYAGSNHDVLVALHARKSANSVYDFRAAHPERPLIVALTGTDLYLDLAQSRVAKQSLNYASHLIVLHERARNDLPPSLRHKAFVVGQSATCPRNVAKPSSGVFEVAVVGHLRPVKDPFRAALAARRLPSESRIRVVHFGQALSASMAKRAAREMKMNRRYHWFGNVPHWRVVRRIARARVLVISSRMEGAANALCEALACGVPILATRIPGNEGMLGRDYPGYFKVGDTARLAALLVESESNPSFLKQLTRACARRRKQVEPQAEKRAWKQLLAQL